MHKDETVRRECDLCHGNRRRLAIRDPRVDWGHGAAAAYTIAQPDKASKGGLKIVQDLKASALAKKYVAARQGRLTAT